MNHTSDEHPWFVASRASTRRRRTPTGTCGATRPASDARRPAAAAEQLGVVVRRPGLDLGPGRGQFYHHTFLAEQPELDWRAPGVEAAQFAMVRGWLDRGVDGFRLDVFNVFLKHPDAAVQPDAGRGTSAWDRQVHVYDRDQPDLPGAHRPVPGDPRRRARAGCRSASCSSGRPRARPR